jgi:predicted dehydrogenase
MTRVRLGLLSTAGINGAILGARAADAPFDVVAVGSRDGSRAQAYAHEHGIGTAHASYDALLGDGNVDAVYIALPNSQHREFTERAARAGIHVLCEKPYANQKGGRRGA